jgi:hypothetical protein
MEGASRYDRWWATTLIVCGVVLLGVVFVAGFAVVLDPGGYYDDWVGGEAVEGPEASFEWTSAGLTVEFLDTSTPGEVGIERWLWDFGNGDSSTDPNPSHRFGEEGEHSVSLDVVDVNGVSSRAEGTVELQTDGANNGEGSIGLSDLADKVTATAERAAKGAGVVVLVIGLFLVLTLAGGRLLRQGVRTLRPIPDRISVKLRPKELALATAEVRDESPSPALTSPEDRVVESERAAETVTTGV